MYERKHCKGQMELDKYNNATFGIMNFQLAHTAKQICKGCRGNSFDILTRFVRVYNCPRVSKLGLKRLPQLCFASKFFTTSMDKLISYHPPMLHFKVTGHSATSKMNLINISADSVAFKLTTNNPKRYGVKPSSGVLNSGQLLILHVTYVAMQQCPSHNETQGDSLQLCAVSLSRVPAGREKNAPYNGYHSVLHLWKAAPYRAIVNQTIFASLTIVPSDPVVGSPQIKTSDRKSSSTDAPTSHTKPVPTNCCSTNQLSEKARLHNDVAITCKNDASVVVDTQNVTTVTDARLAKKEHLDRHSMNSALIHSVLINTVKNGDMLDIGKPRDVESFLVGLPPICLQEDHSKSLIKRVADDLVPEKSAETDRPSVDDKPRPWLRRFRRKPWNK